MLHHAMTKTICLSATNATETNTVSGTLTNGGTGYVEIDTLGYDYAALDVILSKSNTTSNAPSLVTLGDSDVTGTSNYTTITAFSGATATATNVSWLIPVTGVLTANNNVYRLNVDTRARRRYLLVSASPVTTASLTVDARLGRAEISPTNASLVNVQAVVNG
jgi:hypothetical protein